MAIDKTKRFVDLLYSSRGTANWHYLYVFKLVKGTAAPIAVLQSGSRADGGLLGTRIAEGSLILDFADERRREGDCCSRGVIRVRYRPQKGRFVEIGRRQRDSIRFVFYPLPKSGPQTVDTRVQGQDVQLVYTDRNGAEKVLVPSGVNAEPNLSADRSSVVFLRKPNSGETEIWTAGTDGSRLHVIFKGAIRWNGRMYPSSSLRSPQWSIDRSAVYFVTDFSPTDGALWRLDVSSGTTTVIIPGAVVYGVIQTGRYRGYMVANQRVLPTSESDEPSYPVYPFFLFSPQGEKVQQLGDETEDLQELLSNWEHR